jgi:hypothetical protein
VRPTFLAATTLLAALAWTIALVVDGTPWTTAPVLLIGVGMLASAAVATVGMVVVGGRWAHRLGLAAIAMTVVVAVARPIDPLWFIATLVSAAALLTLLSPAVTRTIRTLPSASGPPPRAIAPAVILLVTPAVIGMVGNEATPWALLVVGLTAPNAAFLYSRVIPGGLLVIRLLWPALALALSPLLGWVAGIVSAVIAVVVVATAWDRAVKASYHPPREVGSTFPIPPELAPPEVLDAAQIDEKGRRKT